MTKFYYRRPFSLVLDEVQEYHVKLNAKDPLLNYYETYGKSLWRDVKTFIKNLHDDDIQQISSDYDTTEYSSCIYIWLHIRKTKQEKKIYS
jgi:hypothetical protein